MGTEGKGLPGEAAPEMEQLGRYQLLRRLAVGGMGELLLARARGIGGFEKLVAVKRILPHLAADASFVEMFLQEARIAATLEHPNIVHVSDLGHSGDHYFLVMPFLEGRDLAGLNKELRSHQRGMPLALALYIVMGVASGLHYAHAKRDFRGRPMRLVHRDVSPQNIFLTYEGEVKLLDFGIAKAAKGAVQTKMGSRKGKAQYMSPEQALGRTLDGRSDTFSLGIILYELTTGKPLFRADNDLAVLNMIATQDATPPSQVVPDYPRDLEQILLRALNRDRRQRYAGALDLREALESFAQQHSLRASAVELGAFVTEVLGPPAYDWLADSPAETDEIRAPSVPPPPAAPIVAGVPPPLSDDGSGTNPEAAGASPASAQTDVTSTQPRRNPVLIGGVVAGLVVIGAAAAWVAGGPRGTPPQAGPEAPPGAASINAAPAKDMPDPEQLVAVLNEPQWHRALDYKQRHEVIAHLRRSGEADRIDEPLQLALDLVQASDASRPCAAFDRALKTIETYPNRYFREALKTAAVPNSAAAGSPPDRECDDLAERLDNARRGLAAGSAHGPRLNQK